MCSQVTPGTQIAHYRITGKLGEGGMGAVYRAHDQKLGRDVAIKVLPPSLAGDPDYIARFQREAHVLATLNHPNIAAIYGVEDNAIVMELVEGVEPKGPLPLHEVVRIGRQVADALETAHERGIVHRDLKPANLKVTADGTVKVLDFGLAKAGEPVASSATAAAQSPTLTIRATEAGLIMGTAAYMSPEQAAGKAVDRRADIWAFGVVLWELTTGRQLFSGETVSHILASVLKDDIDLTPIPAGPMRNLIARCLDRNVKTRLRDIGEARIALDAPAEVRQRTKPSILVAGLALIAILALAGHVLRWFSSTVSEQARTVRRFELPLPGTDYGIHRRVAISSDGKRIAWVADRRLWVRDMASGQARLVEGLPDAMAPCWSHDGKWLAAYSLGLRGTVKVQPDTGEIVRLEESTYAASCDWNEDGSRLLLARGAMLMEVTADGGAPRTVYGTLDNATANSFTAASSPAYLPSRDGKRQALFSATPAARIGVVDVDSGQFVDLALAGSSPIYSASGHILFHRAGAAGSNDVWAVPFDATNLRVTGELMPIASGASYPTVSRDGTLVYSDHRETVARVVVRDRTGKQLRYLTEAQANVADIAVSPDQSRVAVVAIENGIRHLWMHEVATGSKRRIAFDDDGLRWPVWSQNGKELLLSVPKNGEQQVDLLPLDGRPRSPLPLRKSSTFATSWSADGRYVLATSLSRLAFDLCYFERGADGGWTVRPLLETPKQERSAMISPDGRHYAFASDQTGQNQIFVRTFPSGNATWQVSDGFGMRPAWSADGTQLYYLSNKELMAVEVSTRDGFAAGKPRPLFPVGHSVLSYDFRRYDTLPGGNFALVEPEEGRNALLHVVENWLEAVKK